MTFYNGSLTDELWEKIVQIFNSEESALHRTRTELEQLYTKIISDTQRKMKIEKKSVTDTGGGKYTHMQYSQEEEQLTALLQNRMVGDRSIYDNDNGKYSRYSY